MTDTEVVIAGQRRGVTKAIRQELRRRNAIEPEIGHMKNDGHLGRNYLKGSEGDAMNVLLVASGHNLRKVLAWLRAFFSAIARRPWCPEIPAWSVRRPGFATVFC